MSSTPGGPAASRGDLTRVLSTFGGSLHLHFVCGWRDAASSSSPPCQHRFDNLVAMLAHVQVDHAGVRHPIPLRHSRGVFFDSMASATGSGMTSAAASAAASGSAFGSSPSPSVPSASSLGSVAMSSPSSLMSRPFAPLLPPSPHLPRPLHSFPRPDATLSTKERAARSALIALGIDASPSSSSSPSASSASPTSSTSRRADRPPKWENGYATLHVPRGPRVRRRPTQIVRVFRCTWAGCDKAYGEISHLNTHVRLKKHGQTKSYKDFPELQREVGADEHHDEQDDDDDEEEEEENERKKRTIETNH